MFSVEHPVFTAQGNQDWIYEESGNPLYWPVDNYFLEGVRDSVFLGENVRKNHKTLTTYFNGMIKYNFLITGFCEPQPPKNLMGQNPEMGHEFRRPMMLIISAKKPA